MDNIKSSLPSNRNYMWNQHEPKPTECKSDPKSNDIEMSLGNTHPLYIYIVYYIDIATITLDNLKTNQAIDKPC